MAFSDSYTDVPEISGLSNCEIVQYLLLRLDHLFTRYDHAKTHPIDAEVIQHMLRIRQLPTLERIAWVNNNLRSIYKEVRRRSDLFLPNKAYSSGPKELKEMEELEFCALCIEFVRQSDCKNELIQELIDLIALVCSIESEAVILNSGDPLVEIKAESWRRFAERL